MCSCFLFMMVMVGSNPPFMTHRLVHQLLKGEVICACVKGILIGSWNTQRWDGMCMWQGDFDWIMKYSKVGWYGHVIKGFWLDHEILKVGWYGHVIKGFWLDHEILKVGWCVHVSKGFWLDHEILRCVDPACTTQPFSGGIIQEAVLCDHIICIFKSTVGSFARILTNPLYSLYLLSDKISNWCFNISRHCWPSPWGLIR